MNPQASAQTRVMKIRNSVAIQIVFFLGVLWAVICPGTTHGETFTATSIGDYGNVTVMEVSGYYGAVFSDSSFNEAARQEVAREFYKTHGDSYDFLVIFSNFDFPMLTATSQAFYTTVRNGVRGIGYELFDNSSNFGSAGRLQGLVDMANVGGWTTDPLDPGFEWTLGVMTHELMHRWGAKVKFIDAEGKVSGALLGLNGAHWSYLFDSEGSSLLGNNWQDNGDGTFTSLLSEFAQDGVSRGRIFSPLELYLMGFNDKSQVPPMLLIDNPTIDPNKLPEIGDIISGIPVTVTIDDIIAAEGERVPSAANAQKEFRTGFVYLATPGSMNAAHLHSIENVRAEWLKRFSILTDGKGMMKAELLPLDEGLPTNPGVPSINPPLTASPDHNAGVLWLINRQRADGSWSDPDGNAIRDTAAAVTALKNFSAGVSSYQSGQIWLGSSVPGNNDYLARKVLGLETPGGALDDLLMRQNADGGWGSAAGYLSSAADTALALKGLAQAGIGAGAPVIQAINYLKSTQNQDGGWGANGGKSLVQPTSHALSTLNVFRKTIPLENEISKAVSWLSGKQNIPDGGFGNSPSTVYDTAAAVTALREAGASQGIVDKGLNYLFANQAEDGSWKGRVFQTALAVQALWHGRVAPDLTISPGDISYSPPSPSTVPVDVTVTANIRNIGNEAVSQVRVSLFEGSPEQGTLLEEKLVAVAGKSTAAVNFITNITIKGIHTFSVVIDSDGRITESSEWNNAASGVLIIDVPPPVVGFEAGSSSGVESGSSVTLKVALDHPWDKTVDVHYSTDVSSTATASADFILPAGTLSFAPGETTKSVQISIVDDPNSEADETIVIRLSNPTNANLGLAQHVHTILDNEAPLVNISSPKPGLTGNTNPTLEYSFSGGAVLVKLDGLPVNKVSGDTLGPLQDGAHSVRVEATNAAGVTGAGEVSFTIASTLPQISISSPKTGVISQNNPVLQYEVAGATNVAVKVDGIAVNKLSGDRLDVLTDGFHTVTIEAVNALGLVASSEVNFTVDTTPFEIKIVSPSEGSIVGRLPLLMFDVNKQCNVKVYVNGRILNKVSGDQLGPLMDGLHVIRVEATDSVGRFTSSETKFSVNTSTNSYSKEWGMHVPELSSAQDCAVDSNGDLIVVGSTNVSLDGNPFDGNVDLYVTKYDKNGSRKWSKQFDAYGNNSFSVSIGPNDDIYVSGEVLGSFDGITGGGKQDIFIIKYSSNGVKQWSRLYGTMYEEWSSDIVVDHSGTVYILGKRIHTKVKPKDPPSFFESVLVKYDTGGTILWEKKLGICSGKALAMAFDGSGDILVTGDAPGALDGGLDPGNNAFIMKFDSSGNKKYTSQLPVVPAGGNSINAYDIAVDAQGNAFIVGTTNGNFIDGIDGHNNVHQSPYSAWQPDIIVAKFDINGALVWTHQLGTDHEDYGKKIAIDTDGGIIITGSTSGHLDGKDHNGNAGAESICVKFDSDGFLKWVLQYTSVYWGSGNSSFGVAIGKDASVYVVGKSYGPIVDIPGYISGGGFTQAYLLKLSHEGIAPPMITLDSFMSPSNMVQQFSGSMSSGAIVSFVGDGNVVVNSIDYVSSTKWLAYVDGFVEGLNPFKVTAIDENGNFANLSAMIEIDTISPSVTINPVDSPVYEKTLFVTGQREEYSEISLVLENSSSNFEVSYTSPTSWSANVFGLKDGANNLIATATDLAGNIGSVTEEILCVPPPQLSLSVAPYAVSNRDQSTVSLSIRNLALPGVDVTVEQVVDANQNGIIDFGEPIIRTLKVTDGVGSTNPNVQGDEDGIANRSVTTTLNYNFTADSYHAPGNYIFRVNFEANTADALFAVTASSEHQTVSGLVTDPLGIPIAGAMVRAVDKWGRCFGYVMTDASGNYVYNFKKAGEYYLAPLASGYVFNKVSSVPISIAVGEAKTGIDLVLTKGVNQVSGQVRDKVSGVGIEGVWIEAESVQSVAWVFSGANGDFAFSLPSGEYSFFVNTLSGGGASSKGYLGFVGPALSLSVSGDSSANAILLLMGPQQVCGNVQDQFMVEVPGAPVQATVTGQTNPAVATALTDQLGKYCLSLSSGEGWMISLVESAAKPLGYVGNVLDGISASTGPFSGNDLQIRAIDVWIAGTVKNGNGLPVEGVLVEVVNASGTVKTSSRTAPDGTYDLGVFADDWTVDVAAEALGYLPVSPVQVVLVSGQVAIRDFSLLSPQVTVSIDAVVSPADVNYQTISGTMSEGATVTVDVDGGAIAGAVSYPSTTNWECTVSNLANGVEHNISVTAQGSLGGTATEQTRITYNAPLVNSIVITKAQYTKRTKLLVVQATSALDASAALEVQGLGVMTWNSKTARWEFQLTLPSAPATVTVQGPEGNQSVPVAVK